MLYVYKKICSLSISSKLFTWLLKYSKCVLRTYKTLKFKKKYFFNIKYFLSVNIKNKKYSSNRCICTCRNLIDDLIKKHKLCVWILSARLCYEMVIPDLKKNSQTSCLNKHSHTHTQKRKPVRILISNDCLAKLKTSFTAATFVKHDKNKKYSPKRKLSLLTNTNT